MTRTPVPPAQSSTADADTWTHRTGRLSTSRPDVDAENVDGRRPASPLHGFGKMWQKTYSVALPESVVGPAELIATWKAEFSTFWPAGNRFYAPLTGIQPGEVAPIELTTGGVPLSTGVLVLHADDESFTLMTPQGHPLAGWTTFSAFPSAGMTVAQTQVLMRASDPLYELGMMAGGHRKEDRFWQETLKTLAARWGIEAEPSTRVVCVDARRQWRQAANVRHNAALLSILHRLTRAIRFLAGTIRAALPGGRAKRSV